MTGSGIFAAGADGEAEEPGSAAAPGRAAPRNYQVLACLLARSREMQWSEFTRLGVFSLALD